MNNLEGVGELKDDILGGEALVDLGKGGSAVLNTLVLLQVDLQEAATVSLVSQALANNLCGEHNILQDLLVHRCQGAAARAELLGSASTTLAGLLGKNAALSKDGNVLAAELLLQLTNQTITSEGVEDGQLGNGHEDEDGLLAIFELKLLGGHKVDLLQRSTKLLGVDLEFVQSIGNCCLGLVRLGVTCLLDLIAASEHLVCALVKKSEWSEWSGCVLNT